MTAKKSQCFCSYLFSSILASLSLFFFSASFFLFSISFKLKTSAQWPLYCKPARWACYFLCVFAVSSSVFVRFGITQLVLARLVAFKVFWIMVNFSEWRVLFLKSEINSWTSVTSLMLARVKDIGSVKYWIYNDILEVLLIEEGILIS